ncbi:ABC transporter ATP-binding protein [Paenibacillus sp. GYB004]|uniref:ABC transporter ATP-binding protein n=1 Tax=Paenibacillus sp. GYB004 TaxID=2994393 RepID=UPI002F96DF12
MELSGQMQPARGRGRGSGAVSAYIWVLSYLSPYQSLFAGLLVCNLLLSLIEMTIPKGIQIVIDQLLPSRSISLFYWLLAGIAILIMLMLAITVLRNYWQRVIQEQAARDLQLDVFRKLRELGLAYTDRHPAGDTLSLLNSEVAAIQSIYQSYLPKLIQYVLFVLVMTTVMFLTHWKLSLAVLPERRFMGRLEEGITHTREILAFHRQDREYQELNNRYQRYMDKSKEEGVITNKHAVYAGAIKWGFNLIVLAFLGYQVLNQAVTIGTFVVVYQFAAQLIDSISGSYHFLIGISSSFASVERYREGAGSESISAGTIRFEELIRSIRFDAVQFGYGEHLTPALHNLNLDIPVGKRIAFVGESGSGKSTIAQLLVRLIEPAGGTIMVNGIPLETVRRDDWASKVSLVFQETYMYPDTIRFNLAFGQNVTDDDIREACAAAQFRETAETLPDGYDTWIGERGAALSGGQKQRIAIARALLADPELLIMDESTSALDSETERLVLRSIEKRRNNGRTTIFITHRLSTIESADLIYVLEHGTVTEQGTYAELIERGPVFRRLVQAMRPDAW